MPVKAILHAVLLFLFLLPQVSNTFVWFNYEVNKAAITEEFCVNKAKPELKCNGKCHLADQLTEPAGPVGNEPVASVFIPQLQLFYLYADDAESVNNRAPLSTTNYVNFYHFSLSTVIDEPPKA